jgi:hypothetical protein
MKIVRRIITKNILLLILIGLCQEIVRADLPIHCIRSEVAGKWTVHLFPKSIFKNNLSGNQFFSRVFFSFLGFDKEHEKKIRLE